MDHTVPKNKKRRRFWRLRRQRESSPALSNHAQLPPEDEDEPWSSASDGRVTPSFDGRVTPSFDDAAILTNPSLILGSPEVSEGGEGNACTEKVNLQNCLSVRCSETDSLLRL